MIKEKKISVIGAGDLGRIVINILKLNNEDYIELYDDEKRGEVYGVKIKGKIKDCVDKDIPVVIAIGDVNKRMGLYNKFLVEGFRFMTVIHPSAIVSPYAYIENGCIIKENAVVGVGTKVRANTIIGNNSTICHDCEIGKHCRIAPGVTIAGRTVVEDECYLAVNVSVDRKLNIGTQSVIASGCTIWKDVPKKNIVKLPTKMKMEEINEKQ